MWAYLLVSKQKMCTSSVKMKVTLNSKKIKNIQDYQKPEDPDFRQMQKCCRVKYLSAISSLPLYLCRIHKHTLIRTVKLRVYKKSSNSQMSEYRYQKKLSKMIYKLTKDMRPLISMLTPDLN